MSANVKAFKAFLKERQTGLVQRSKAWVKARQHTIGASEIAVLTGSSPFDTPASLMRKKLHAPDLSNNVACAWGKLFEPFARAYIEWEHNTQVFGNTITLNLSEGHPLYGKVTCSPDGYFQALDGSIEIGARSGKESSLSRFSRHRRSLGFVQPNTPSKGGNAAGAPVL